MLLSTGRACCTHSGQRNAVCLSAPAQRSYGSYGCGPSNGLEALVVPAELQRVHTRGTQRNERSLGTLWRSNSLYSA